DYSDSGGYSGYWLCSSNYKESWLKVNLPDYIMKGEYKKEMPTEVSSGLISLHAPNCMSIKVFGDNLALTSKVAHWNDVRKATVVDQGLEYSIKTTYEDSTEDDIKKHRQVLDSGPVILHSPELNLDSKRLIPYVFEHIIIRVEKKRLKQLNPELDQFGKQSYKENNLFRLHVLHTQDLPNNIFYGGIFDNTIDSKLGYFRGVIHGLNEYAERWAEAFSEIVTELMAKLPERSIEIYKPSIFGYKIK
ncbi:MAG: hypothetical protein NT001_04585, partial [Candidatus Woesearchaeota archaeon]|nr:hypothetical protein [Candidatus Woesearchaeota archaeon]